MTFPISLLATLISNTTVFPLEIFSQLYMFWLEGLWRAPTGIRIYLARLGLDPISGTFLVSGLIYDPHILLYAKQQIHLGFD